MTTGPLRPAVFLDRDGTLGEERGYVDRLDLLSLFPGTADAVLTFRNVHNWVMDGNEQVMFKALFAVLKPGGTLGVVDHRASPDQPPAEIRRIFIRQLQILGSTMGSLGEFQDLLSLVQRSGLKPVIDSQYALDDVHGALDRLASGQQFGKVVIHIGSGS